MELDFLERVLSDVKENQTLIESIPECRGLFAKVVHLYREITGKALENEERRRAG